MLNLTPVVRNIIIINVVVFICTAWLVPDLGPYLGLYEVSSGAFRPYQLFTYMFVHGGIGHIFFNMLALAFIAPILEQFWGPRRFLLFYMITGIGAGAFDILVGIILSHGPTLPIPTVGASGAIYGVLMGFGMIFPNMQVMLLIPPIPIKAKYLVWVLGGLTFLMDTNHSVAHFAHLGGIVVAYILIRIWRSRGGSY